METFTAGGLLVRFLLALALVLVTFNPTGVSYLHWFFDEFPAITAAKVVVGIGLFIAWIVFVRATMQSIGIVGVILAVPTVAILQVLFEELVLHAPVPKAADVPDEPLAEQDHE